MPSAPRLTDERLREAGGEWVPRCPCDTPVLNDGDRCTICEAVESLRAIAREHADRGEKGSHQRDRYTSQPIGEFDRHEARRLNTLADDLRNLAPAALLAEVEALRGERDEDEKRWRFLTRDPESFRALYDLFGEVYVNNDTGELREGRLKPDADAVAAIRWAVDSFIEQDTTSEVTP